ncbi:hypothetical protein [Ekhidna sp.]|uniref:hypothetical protein n=1 Tax=Ekhidna sp. TaxID=2608089 RepID=UPI0032EB2D60
MNEENRTKIDKLIEDLKSKSKRILNLIEEKYLESDKSGGFLNPGESMDIDYDNLRLKNEHLALYKSVEGEINSFLNKIEIAMQDFDFNPESSWLRDKEKIAEEYANKLNKLL